MGICSRREKEEIGRCCRPGSNLFNLHENFYAEEFKSVLTVLSGGNTLFELLVFQILGTHEGPSVRLSSVFDH